MKVANGNVWGTRVPWECQRSCGGVLGPLGIGVKIAGGNVEGTQVLWECRRPHGGIVGLCDSMMAGNVTMPGVLLCMTHLCRRGIFLRLHFAIGFLACMMGGMPVRQGIDIMGVSSIVLCLAS